MPCRSRKEVYAVKKSLTGYFSAQYTDGRQAGRQAGRVKLCPFLLPNFNFIREIERRSYDTG